MEKILGPEFKNSNQNVKAKFMDLLFTLNIMEKGKIVGEVMLYFNNEEKLQKFVNYLLKFYSYVEFMTDAEQTGVHKYRYRFFMAKFLSTALKREEYVRAF